MTRPSPFGPRLKSIIVTPLATADTDGLLSVMLVDAAWSALVIDGPTTGDDAPANQSPSDLLLSAPADGV